MFVLTFLLWASPAAAWKHQRIAWPELPVAVCVDHGQVDASWADDAYAAVDAWNAAGRFLGLELFLEDDCERAPITVLLQPGIAGIVTMQDDGPAVEVGGCDYAGATGATLEVGVDLATPHDELMTDCQGHSLRRIVAHDLGHALGLAHSCEEGEACDDPDLANALMFWTSGPCETGYAPQTDDLAGLAALYYTTVCDLPLDDEEPSASWDTGYSYGGSWSQPNEEAEPRRGCATTQGHLPPAWMMFLPLLFGRRG